MSELPDDAADRDATEYDEMLAQIDDVIAELSEKIEEGRIRDVETEKCRIKQYRTLGYLIRTKRQVLEDKTLEELQDEVDRLKDERGARAAP